MSLIKIVKSQPFKDLSIIFILLGLVTVLFNVSRLDIILESYFYKPEEGWFLKFKPFWDYFYRFGIFPGYLFGLAGLIMIAISFWNAKYLRYRKAAYMLVYTLVLGPGLIINVALKDHWGRPRPFEIKEFGGKQEFLKVGVLGEANGGKSFPCGHCSMGFFLAVPFLILRNRNLKLAYAFLISGIIYGLLIGLSRMIAGGHFPSDVLWSGGIVWLVAISGAYMFKIDKPINLIETNQHIQKKKARLATFLVSILLLLVSLGLVLATPYISQKSISVSCPKLAKLNTKTIFAELKSAVVDISPDTALILAYKVNAFGFPNSKIRGRLTGTDTLHYQLQWMGWFTEVSNSFHLGYPAELNENYVVNLEQGKIFCSLPDSSLACFHFIIENGELYLHYKPDQYYLEGDSNLLVNPERKQILWLNGERQVVSSRIIKFEFKKGHIFLQ